MTTLPVVRILYKSSVAYLQGLEGWHNGHVPLQSVRKGVANNFLSVMPSEVVD